MAATFSQPGGGLLSKVNKRSDRGDGSVVVRLSRIAAAFGMEGLCTRDCVSGTFMSDSTQLVSSPSSMVS